MGHRPADFGTVKFKGVVAAIFAHRRGTGQTVTNLGLADRAVCAHIGAMGGRSHRSRHVFIELGRCRKVDILVGGVRRIKVAIEIASVVHIEATMNLDFGSISDESGTKNNGQYKLTHKILPKKFRCKDRNISAQNPTKQDTKVP